MKIDCQNIKLVSCAKVPINPKLHNVFFLSKNITFRRTVWSLTGRLADQTKCASDILVRPAHPVPDCFPLFVHPLQDGNICSRIGQETENGRKLKAAFSRRQILASTLDVQPRLIFKVRYFFYVFMIVTLRHLWIMYESPETNKLKESLWNISAERNSLREENNFTVKDYWIIWQLMAIFLYSPSFHGFDGPGCSRVM